MTDTQRDLERHCRSIAEELIAIYDGERLADEYEAELLGVEEGEPLTMWDYFTTGNEIFDIEYAIGSDRQTLRGVRLLVACGGPNIYIDTNRGAVLGYWWTDRAEASIPAAVADSITDVFQDLWYC